MLLGHLSYRGLRSGRLPAAGPLNPQEHPDSGDHHPDVLAVHRYWEEKRRGRPTPSRADIDGFFAPTLEAALAIPDKVVTTKAPLSLHRDFTVPDGRLGYEDLIMLPLSEDGERVTMIMGYTHHRLA
jgi:hypothetical protein